MNKFKKIRSFISLSHILTIKNIQFAFNFKHFLRTPFKPYIYQQKCVYTLCNSDIKFVKDELKYMYSFFNYEEININILENYYIREKQDLNKKLESKLIEKNIIHKKVKI